MILHSAISRAILLRCFIAIIFALAVDGAQVRVSKFPFHVPELHLEAATTTMYSIIPIYRCNALRLCVGFEFQLKLLFFCALRARPVNFWTGHSLNFSARHNLNTKSRGGNAACCLWQAKLSSNNVRNKSLALSFERRSQTRKILGRGCLNGVLFKVQKFS